MLAEGILQARLPDAPWRDLVASFGYTPGFVFVILGRQQLFTETTLTVVLPFLAGTKRAAEVARFWAIVFAANVAGTILFALASTSPHIFDPEMRHSFAEIGFHAAARQGSWVCY